MPGDIALARALSPLVEISHQADAMRSAVAFISPNGMFVSSPEPQGISTPALLRRFSTMYYYRGQLPEHNPRREVLWTPVYTGLQDGEAVSTLSAPVYLGKQFRGVVVMDITQSRLLSLQLSTGNTEDDGAPLEFGFLNTNGSIVYFRNGAVIAQRPARFSPSLLQTAAKSVDTWMRQGSGYLERDGQYLLYRRIGQSHWILLAATDNAELTIATARRVLGSPVIAAWIVLGLLLIGTLRIVTNIFGHYVEASARLETLARSDPLTGLANRRRFQEVFAEARERANRATQQPAPMAVLMLDIDFFKRVNDCFGHAAGDRVLTIFAAILRANLRGVYLPARMGGEEFAALLPDIDLAAATAVAERVRLAIEGHTRDVTVPAGTEHPEAIAFTVSIGVAASPVDGPIDYEALMHVADERRYLAKQGGRNRVVQASTPVPDVKA
ncbi:diguanylate cyclase [Paraburkholderia sp. A2WS-5]|uniref:diguanylate cyclase n=1 Tax=unclassified Paraburkholderia TaxID=2615204 RepID=UPI003B7F6F34